MRVEMAKTFVKLTMFYVEQGLAQTIEVFNSADQLQALVLVDFGTDRIWTGSFAYMKSKDNALGNSCTQLEQKIDGRGKIDILVISHTDNDHINLLVKFLQSNNIGIDRVILGGTPRGRSSLDKFTDKVIEKQRGSKVLKGLGEQLVKIFPNPAQQVNFFASMNHYFIEKGGRYVQKSGEETRLAEWEFGPSQMRRPKAFLRVVTSRHFVDDTEVSKDAAAYINTNSVVLAMEVYADENDTIPASVIFLTGDIQWTTMEYLTECFEKGGTDCFPFLNPGVHRAMIVPHHGALKTACKGNNIEKDTDGSNLLEVQLADLRKWGEKMDCEILAVSAKAGGNRQHPCQQTMDKLSTGHLRTNLPPHQNFEISAFLARNAVNCHYTETVIPADQRAVYTSYVGKVTAPGGTQSVETARNVIITVDEEGNMAVSAEEREGA